MTTKNKMKDGLGSPLRVHDVRHNTIIMENKEICFFIIDIFIVINVDFR